MQREKKCDILEMTNLNFTFLLVKLSNILLNFSYKKISVNLKFLIQNSYLKISANRRKHKI